MKRAIIFAMLLAASSLVVALNAALQDDSRFDPIGKIQKVKDNLYMIPGQGSNTAVFVTANGVVLVDTKVANQGQAILDQVKSVTDKAVTIIINTHTHMDHVSSNPFFPASVDIVAHENAKTYMEKMDLLKGKPNALPDRTYKDRLTLLGGADRIDLYHFGAGHTNGDTLVVFPQLRVMHAGDLFAWKQAPIISVGNGGSGTAFPTTIEKAAKEIRNVDTVIPGHSAITTWDAFVEYGVFNREFLKAVEAAHRAGKTPEAALAELRLPDRFKSYVANQTLPGYELVGSGASRAQNNVKAIYTELSK